MALDFGIRVPRYGVALWSIDAVLFDLGGNFLVDSECRVVRVDERKVVFPDNLAHLDGQVGMRATLRGLKGEFGRWDVFWRAKCTAVQVRTISER